MMDILIDHPVETAVIPLSQQNILTEILSPSMLKRINLMCYLHSICQDITISSLLGSELVMNEPV